MRNKVFRLLAEWHFGLLASFVFFCLLFQLLLSGCNSAQTIALAYYLASKERGG